MIESARKIWSIFSPEERVRGLILVGGMFIGAGFEAVGVSLVVPFIALVNEPDVAFDLPAARPVLEVLGISNPGELLIGAGLGLLVILLIKSSYLIYFYHMLSRFVFDKQQRLSRQLLEGYLAAPYTFHLQRNTADLLKNTTETVQRFCSGVMIAIVFILAELLVVAALLTLLLIMAPAATLAALLVLSLPTAVFYTVFRRRLSRMGHLRERSFAAMVRWVNQALGGIKETKVMERGGYFLDRHAEQIKGVADSARTVMFVNMLPHSIIDSIVAGGLVAFVVVVLLRGFEVQAVLPLMGLFAVAAVRLTPSVNRIISGLNTLRFHFAATDVIYDELIEIRRQLAPRDRSALVPSESASLHFKHSLVVDNLSYRYSGENGTALSKVSLTIPRGASVGIVGPTGSGKTTLVDLIIGLLTPTDGRILVDGNDIFDDLAAWQRNIGYIPQEVYLTDDTIRCNVAFALHDHEIDNDRVWRALRAARLEEVVRGLPVGLDTFVGERGARLSGGEVQRMGIARALYRDPDVLVLDEATASLDGKTEAAIMGTLDALRGHKTILIIAHRPTIVENCDRIYSLSEGRLEEFENLAEAVEVDGAVGKRTEPRQ